MPVQAMQGSQYQPAALQPNYNAVKIDINNPQVNAPATQGHSQNQAAPVAPVYGSIPEASVYEVPQSSTQA